jgi:hypothetical protein
MAHQSLFIKKHVELLLLFYELLQQFRGHGAPGMPSFRSPGRFVAKHLQILGRTSSCELLFLETCPSFPFDSVVMF